MIKIQTLLNLKQFIIALVICSFFATTNLQAAGISIDAGLTPSKGRLMFRSQLRYNHRDNFPPPMVKEMKMQMFPVMLAYGVRSDMTLIIRQAYVRQEMIMMGGSNVTTGFGDHLVLVKYRLLRKNTKNYTIGIAPTLGLEIPVGNYLFTSHSWDVHFGCFASGRKGKLGIDLNLKYIWNGISMIDDYPIIQGDEFIVQSALDYRFGFGANAEYSIAPVGEFAYNKITSNHNREGNTVLNTGESYLQFSPGLVFTWSSFILEGLVQIPVWQKQTGDQTERDYGFIIGFRLMN